MISSKTSVTSWVTMRVMTKRDLIAKLLNHVRLCGVCLRPATYARGMCDICDVCASDPELDWYDPPGKEACLLNQAATVREASKFLKEEHEST